MTRRRTVTSLAALVLIAGCSSTPPPRVHTLMPADVAAPAAGLAGGAPIAVVIEQVRVTAQVDQPQWLVRLPDGSLALLEQDRWASPLRDEIRLALREALITRYGVTEARPPQGAIPIRVGVDVRRFDTVAGQGVRTGGTWTLTAGEAAGARQLRCEWLYREDGAGDTNALAAAHRRAVSRLGDAIGAGLGRLSRNEPASCPARDAAS